MIAKDWMQKYDIKVKNYRIYDEKLHRFSVLFLRLFSANA
jgi:hypothetical protein